MNLFSHCYYHPRTSSIITDRTLLDSETVGGLLNMLPEDERYGLKYVTICLEDGVAGKVDRESLVAALEVFGQIRDSGINPKDIFRDLEEKEVEVAPVVKARQLISAKETRPAARRKSSKHLAANKRRKGGTTKNGSR